MKYIVSIAVLLMLTLQLVGQEQKIVQFSGNLIDAETNEEIPYVSIRIKNTYRGAIANEQGFFSIAVPERDTVVFTAVGFKKLEVVIPADLKKMSYTAELKLVRDTVMMEEVSIYPWPSRAKFKEAFMNTEVPQDDYDRALENMNKQALSSLSMLMVPDGSESYKMTMDDMRYGLSHYNIPNFIPMGNTKVPATLMSPTAWAQFIKALKNGDFKKKE